jgi:bifunctional non-homologous end joining protein LigD
MPDQLSLQLPVRPPGLPSTMRPMRATAAGGPFDSPDHLFEPVWGGVPMLAFIEGGGSSGGVGSVRFIGEDGVAGVMPLPELADLWRLVAAETAVVHGEIVVVDRSGRNDPLALAARLRGRPGPPAAFLAFDLPYLDGRPLIAMPLERRREKLRRVLAAGDEVVVVPSVVGEGTALYNAATRIGIAGVMGRVRRSPYLPGIRSRLWQFVSATRQREVDHDAIGEREAKGAPVGPASVEVGGAEADGDTGRDRNAPMIALIRSLPFDEPT